MSSQRPLDFTSLQGLIRRRWIGVVVLIALAALLARASFDAYFLLDDFGMLAIVRQFSHPLEPFYREHIPGGHFYRPVGLLIWWLSQSLFGAAAAWQYALNLGLLLAAALALWAVVERASGVRVAGFLAALVFVVHPVAIGTSLWQSDRFDLLALIFGLLGLLSALAYSRQPLSRHWRLAALWFGLALLSKEIALAPLGAAVVLCLASTETLSRRRRIAVVAAAVALVLAWLLLRTLILETDRTGQLLDRKALQLLFVDGLQMWLIGIFNYVSYWPWLSAWKLLGVAAGLLIVGSLCVLALLSGSHRQQRPVLWAAAAMLVATALLQWPVLGLQNLRGGSASALIEQVVNARFFFMALAAIVLILAVLLADLARRRIDLRWGIGLALLLMLLPWSLASQQAAQRYRDETQTQRDLVLAATAAIDAATIPKAACQIYLLDTDNWMFSWVSDQAVKAVIGDLGRVEHCLIQTEHTPWYHIVVMDELGAAALAPLTTMPADAHAANPPRLGRARIILLNLASDIDASAMNHALFFSWQQGRFVDVTADVASGQRRPNFLCNRRPVQCPP